MHTIFWINLSVVLLVSGYVLWTAYGGWRLFLDLIRAQSADDVLKNVQERRQYYFSKGMSNLVGLAFFLCIKATLIISKQFVPNIFSTLVFGGIPDWNPLNTFGCLGVVLISASLVCFYQHVKSKHYLDVLYTFREQLGLTGLE
ncbi:MAG: hypothetical protein ABR955_05770 [Verrucomicrobiota bacterium]|jgi:hypothetical protein